MLEFHPDAEIELEEAIEWYEGIKQGLGERFFKEYQRLRTSILANPERYPIEFGEVRKAVFNKFPYILLYFVWDDLIYVLAVFHTSQDPEIWRTRMEKF